MAHDCLDRLFLFLWSPDITVQVSEAPLSDSYPLTSTAFQSILASRDESISIRS